MKIIPNNTLHAPFGANKKKVSKENSDLRPSNKYDKLSIAPPKHGENINTSFVDTLKKQIAAEVKAGASNDAINDVRVQIALGKYDINADLLAGRILLD